MPIYDAYGERKARDAREDTWGHLKPQNDKVYHGWIEVSQSAFGDGCLHNIGFEGLDSSPWLYDACATFGLDNCPDSPGIHRFTGTFSMPDVFVGKWTHVYKG